MKNLIFSFVTLLIVVHTTTEAHPDAVVLDTEGNPLLTGEMYYVLPLKRPGHGIVPHPMPNETCSYGVSQLIFGRGIPVIFKVVNSSALLVPIYDYNDLDISFSRSIGCGSTDVWRRGEKDNVTDQYLVKIGEGSKTKGGGSIGNAFQIRKVADDYYQFVFCPETCGSCLLKCYDVGFFHKDGPRRLLAVSENTDNSYFIMFSKAEPEPELARY